MTIAPTMIQGGAKGKHYPSECEAVLVRSVILIRGLISSANALLFSANSF